MKKIISIVLVMAFAVSLMTACQATPEVPIVVGKDVDEMIEKATETETEPAEPIVFPEKYECKFTEFEGRFNVTADVELATPENITSLPTVKTCGRTFSQEETTGIFDFLFAEETAYDALNKSSVNTKAGIQARIVALEQAIAFGYDGEPLTEAQVTEHLREIEQLKAEYSSAADEAEEKAVSDGTLVEGNIGGHIGKQLSVYNSDQTKTLDIWSSTESDSYMYYTTDRVYDVYDSDSAVNESTAQLPDGLLSYKEADAIAEELLASMNAVNLRKMGVYLADDRKIGLVDDIVKDAENYAYKFVYATLLGGVPIANIGDIVVESEFGAWRYYEKIEIVIDNEGIAEFIWRAPIEIKEVVSKHTNIVDFETAARRFEELMYQSYSPWVASDGAAESGLKISFDISDVELSLMRIIDPKAAEPTGDIYVPAYMFCGVGKLEQNGQLIGYIENPGMSNVEFTGKKSFVIINAIDGSIIDIAKGY